MLATFYLFCRDLVKNLVLGYLHASEGKRVEVLHLIAKILEFSANEVEQACRGHGRGGWLGGLWRTPSQVPPEMVTIINIFHHVSKCLLITIAGTIDGIHL